MTTNNHKIDNYDRQFKRLTDDYGMSFQSALCVMEHVSAYHGDTTQANKDALQVIANLYGVTFCFHQSTPNRFALTGIFTMLRASFLYHNAKTVSKFCNQKNAIELWLRPGANNHLVRAELAD